MKKLTLWLLFTIFATHAAWSQNSDQSYSEKVRRNATAFHKNFSTGDFDKNAPLVNEKIYVNSNTVIVIGREKFVNRIKRYHTPFPTLQLKDRIIIVDQNEVGLLYLMQGTHDGPYGTIPASGNKINVYAAEFFTMDDQARMKELLTITKLDHLLSQIKGEEKITQYESVTLLPVKPGTPATKKAQKLVQETFVQDFNTRDFDAMEKHFAHNVQVNHNGKTGTGFQAVKENLLRNVETLPDLTFHLDKNLVEGDRGAIAYTLIGTYIHHGSPRRVTQKEGTHFQFNDQGKITHMVVVSNADELKQQLN